MSILIPTALNTTEQLRDPCPGRLPQESLEGYKARIHREELEAALKDMIALAEVGIASDEEDAIKVSDLERIAHAKKVLAVSWSPA